MVFSLSEISKLLFRFLIFQSSFISAYRFSAKLACERWFVLYLAREESCRDTTTWVADKLQGSFINFSLSIHIYHHFLYSLPPRFSLFFWIYVSERVFFLSLSPSLPCLLVKPNYYIGCTYHL